MAIYMYSMKVKESVDKILRTAIERITGLTRACLRPLIFRHILAEHRRAEEIVKASTLAWTIVRPTALTNRPAAGYVASLELQPRTFVTARADVAAFIADELENDGYIRQLIFVTSRRKQTNDT